MAKPNPEVQKKAILAIRDFNEASKRLSESQKAKLFDVYSEWKSFSEKKQADWSTSFKVNKAHQVVETVLPRLTAKDPRFIVSPRNNEVDPKHAEVVQDYLTYLFDEYNLMEPIRLWAKSMLIYGNSYARVKYKYEVARVVDVQKAQPDLGLEGVEGEEVETVSSVKEEVVGEYPTIENVSWTDIMVDPRYVMMEDMPGINIRTNGVRLRDLERQEKVFNLDKVKELSDLDPFRDDENGYKQRVFQITGVDTVTTRKYDKNSLTVDKFYGHFIKSKDDDPKKERMYEMWVVEDSVMIYCEEITHLPFEDIKAFEDPEQHFATGFVEPIMEIQKEMNFKKNSASTYINNSLNRSWLWSPQSGVNPKNLISKPNNIVVASMGVQRAQAELQEIPHRQLPSDYFQEGNDLERQIQAMSFTVDTSNPRNQQALTNTATGARIKFFESNSVINEVRKHFEEGLERLAYKLLLCTFDNLDDNIVIKKQGTEEFWQINKELLRDAITKYSIKVEANSSSFDDIENRREEAIAFYNIVQQAFAAQIVTKEAVQAALREVIHTFEKKDVEKFVSSQDIESFLGQQGAQGGAPGGQKPLDQPEAPPSAPADVTQQVAGGQLVA